MATHIIQFGTYTFGSTFSVAGVPSEQRISSESIPMRDGAVMSGSRLREKVITVRGMLRADTLAAMRSAMDTLLAAVNAGRQKLYLWSDRYVWAYKTGFATDYDETSFKRYCFVTVEFTSDTALWEAETESSDTWNSPATGNIHGIAIGGNAPALPTFEITCGASGSLNIEIEAGGISFSLIGQVNSGDVLVIDCDEETVELELDYSDYMSLFDMVFLQFTGNATNTLTFTNSGTVAISSIVTKWRNRWY